MITTNAVETEYVIESEYGTAEWITYKLRRAEKDLYDVAIFLFRETVALDISFSKVIKQYRQQGAVIPCSERTFYRYLESLPEYQQRQEQKRLNPSAAALRKQAERSRKRDNCQHVKSHNEEENFHVDETLLIEAEVVEVANTQAVEGEVVGEEKRSKLYRIVDEAG